MAFNGFGLYTRIYNWVTDAANAIPITPSRMDGDAQDIANALSQCMTKTGVSTPTANLPMGGYKFTGLGAGANPGDSVAWGQTYNATTATALQTARTINGVAFDGSANITIGASVSTLTFGTHLTGGSFNGSAAVTIGTDATNANTVSTVVARDASGNFSAGTISAVLAGNASTATTLQTARTINGVSFDGSSNITISSTGSTLTFGTHLTGTSYNGSSAVTIGVDATNANTASTMVARDASGNFSAGTITAALSGNATTATTATTANAVIAGCTDGTNELGYKGVPQNSQSANYTTVLADKGYCIYHPSSDTTARTFTIASNASVAYPIGTVISFDNEFSAGTLTLSISSDTLVLDGTGSTGSRTLAAGGVATARKVGTTRWRINGIALT